MTIDHVVDGETELDSELFNPWVDHMNGLQTGALPIALAGIEEALGEYEPLVNVATSEAPTKIGHALANTPDGRGWYEGSISADWFSDLNDAIDIARQGVRGVRPIVLSKDTDYDRTGMDPVRLYSGVVISGDSPVASRVRTADSDAVLFQVASGDLCDRVVLRDFRLHGSNVAAVGLDWRGITRGLAQNIEVQGFTDTQLWVGGDLPAYTACWNNSFRDLRLMAPSNGSALRLSGRTESGSGVSTANRNMFAGCRVKVLDSPTSIGVDLQHGDTNQFIGGDYGYGGAGTIFKLDVGAYINTFAFGASEDAEHSVDVAGSRNLFIGWSFPSASDQVIRAGATYNQFIGCPHLNIVDEEPDANRTVVIGLGPSEFHAIRTRTQSGSYAIQVQRVGESNPRFRVVDSGRFQWLNPATDTPYAGISPVSNATLLWDDGTFVRLPKHASLPTANAARRGATIRIEGGIGVADGVYICVKDAADAYSWKAVTLA